MEKNKSYGSAVREGGARYYHAAGENGYGLNSDLPFSSGSPEYQSGPNRQMINASGKENFTDPRFNGTGGQSRLQASASGNRDSIETAGGNDDALNRRAY